MNAHRRSVPVVRRAAPILRALFLAVCCALGVARAQSSVGSIDGALVDAQNQLLAAATFAQAGQTAEATDAVNQAVAGLGAAATDLADPDVQAELGSRLGPVTSALTAAQKAAGAAQAAVTANKKSAKAIVQAIKVAAGKVARAEGSLVGSPLLVETDAKTAGFHKPGQTVSFAVNLGACGEVPTVSVTNVGTAPVVDLASVAFDASTGTITLRMGLAHGGASVEVTACGRTVRRLLHNYGVAAPRVRFAGALPHAKLGEQYDQLAATATGGVAPYHFTLDTGGGFPPLGIILGLDGRLTGTPVAPGTYSFGVCAVDVSASQTCGRVTVIVDPPDLSITDEETVEGQSGTTDLSFTVTLAAASTKVVTVKVATAAGSASPGSDFVSVPSTTLTFAPGETSKSVTVTVNGDTTVEPDETFFVRLSKPVNAGIATPRGKGTILNDDLPESGTPVVTITSATVTDFVPGQGGFTYTIVGTVSGPVGTRLHDDGLDLYLPMFDAVPEWGDFAERDKGEPYTAAFTTQGVVNSVGTFSFGVYASFYDSKAGVVRESHAQGTVTTRIP